VVFGFSPEMSLQNQLRSLKRRLVPYLPNPEFNSITLEQGLRQIESLRDAGVSLQGATALEIGTGWEPIIPLLYRLAGVELIYLTDTRLESRWGDRPPWNYMGLHTLILAQAM
jgi:hypothetical protein